MATNEETRKRNKIISEAINFLHLLIITIMIKTRKFILILLIIFISSCKSETKEKSKEEKQTTQNKVDNSDELEVFDVDKMLFNGKSKRYFSLQEFETNFGKIDSTK